MRCLQEIAESSHLHQMTVENLATVFAPSLFRGIQEKETKTSKKRNGSQEDLLRTFKRNNDLQVKVVKVLIENAEKIGAAKDCYKASRSVSDAKNKERKLIASSLQRHAEAAKPPSGHPYGGAQMKINAALLRKNSRSTTNLANEPSTSSLMSYRNSDDDSLNSPRKVKQGRSNSVVRMVKNFKKSLTNLTSDAFMSTPDPPGLANKRIPMPTYHQQTPITQSVSMDPSTTTSSDDTLSDFARRKHPEYVGVNFQEIRKVMSPKDSKKRPPIPSFDNRSSSNDEKKENEQEIENSTKKSTILRKRSSSGSKKPMGLSNATNIQRAATQMNRRDQPLKVDRSRRSTAPVKTSIKRMQPNSKASGLTLSRKARSFQRRSSSRRSGSNTSTSSSNFENSNDMNSQDILEQKGIDARRRRRMKKKENSESLTNVYNSSTILTTPNSPTKVQNSISPVLSVTTKSINANIEPTSDLPLTSDISSPELQRAVPVLVSPLTPKSSMISLITKKKATQPLSIDVNVTPQREPLPLITPSPDSGCSLASSKQLQTDSDHVFVKPELPKRFIRPAQVDIRPTGTSIYFPTESSLAKQKSPVRKSPLPHISARRSSSAASSSTRATSKSPSRLPRPRIIPASPSDHKLILMLMTTFLMVLKNK
uniref:Rho-GAP domain-containing protein n=1 Tax=Panagrolaimus davidi TaxID=227884 RepID=A0A914PDC1_9BILA